MQFIGKERWSSRMQESMVADITIFDPENVTDNASYKAGEHGLPSNGIPYLIVNGQIVVKRSKALKVWAVLPIHYLVEKTGPHVPASKKQGLKVQAIDSCPLKTEH